jgi:hypothetical protein
MLRFMAAGTVVLMLASGAPAGERYEEIWNPPEARTTPTHRQRGASRTANPRLSANGATKPPTRRVADRVSKFSTGKQPTAVSRKRKAARPSPTIPRAIGPDGNVLRVNDEAPATSRRRQTV